MTTPIMNIISDVQQPAVAGHPAAGAMSLNSTRRGARSEATIGTTTVEVAITV